MTKLLSYLELQEAGYLVDVDQKPLSVAVQQRLVMTLRHAWIEQSQLECDVKNLEKKVKDLSETMQDLSCDGCVYEDQCPDGAKHYVCTSCKLRDALGEPR